MIYPQFIKKDDTIGITAPSDGIIDKLKVKRLDNAIKKLNDYGYHIIETASVRKSQKGKSNESSIQAKELEELFLKDEVKAIICASGGDFLLEMLSHFDFNKVLENPKWFQGYSDPTGLLFTITTNLDIATIYADNFKTFGMDNWHESLSNNLSILEGKIIKQNSFFKYESEDIPYLTGLEEYNLTKNVKWHNLNDEKEIVIKGRIIGGCLDLLNEIFGTKYDKTREFIEKYKNDGIIWYFDNCELSSEALIRTFWKFKDNGWFNHCKGILFGRSMTHKSYYDISFKEALKHSLNDLNIPIITDMDFGHVSPRMTLINGAIAKVSSKDGQGSIEFELK